MRRWEHFGVITQTTLKEMADLQSTVSRAAIAVVLTLIGTLLAALVGVR